MPDHGLTAIHGVRGLEDLTKTSGAVDPDTLFVVSLPCPHFSTAMAEVPAAATMCQACVDAGDTWVHLRQCLVCGNTACCDNSQNRHATGHANSTGHAIIQSAQPGEKWAWCYPDNAFFIPAEGGGWELFED